MVVVTQQHALGTSTCPIAKTASLVGDAVILLIVRDLFSGPKRFKDFETSLPGVSTRTLSKKLALLTEHALVERSVRAGKPARVEYQLTERGHGLHDITEAMRHYGETYLSA